LLFGFFELLPTLRPLCGRCPYLHYPGIVYLPSAVSAVIQVTNVT
jgi:hypothetical protein